MTKDVVQSRRYVIRNRLSKYKLACISQSQSHNLTIRSWIAITNLFLSVHIISDSPDSTKIAIVVIMQGKTERGIRMEGAKSQERFEGNVHHSSLLESNHLNPPYWTDFTGSHPPSHHRATHLDGGFVRECACARRSSDPFRFVSVCCLLFASCTRFSEGVVRSAAVRPSSVSFLCVILFCALRRLGTFSPERDRNLLNFFWCVLSDDQWDHDDPNGTFSFLLWRLNSNVVDVIYAFRPRLH